MSKSKKQDAFESISLKGKQLYKRSEKWVKEFRKIVQVVRH